MQASNEIASPPAADRNDRGDLQIRIFREEIQRRSTYEKS